jgi:hypothetical protein
VTATGLPSGLTLGTTPKTASGVVTVSGKVTASVGTYPVKLTITDNALATSQTTFSWPVVAAPTLSQPANQSTKHNSSGSLQLSASCAAGPCSYSANSLPPGLSVDSATGLISGTAGNSTKSYTVTVTVTDAAGVAVSKSFTWAVTT